MRLGHEANASPVPVVAAQFEYEIGAALRVEMRRIGWTRRGAQSGRRHGRVGSDDGEDAGQVLLVGLPLARRLDLERATHRTGGECERGVRGSCARACRLVEADQTRHVAHALAIDKRSHHIVRSSLVVVVLLLLLLIAIRMIVHVSIFVILFGMSRRQSVPLGAQKVDEARIVGRRLPIARVQQNRYALLNIYVFVIFFNSKKCEYIAIELDLRLI